MELWIFMPRDAGAAENGRLRSVLDYAVGKLVEEQELTVRRFYAARELIDALSELRCGGAGDRPTELSALRSGGAGDRPEGPAPSGDRGEGRRILFAVDLGEDGVNLENILLQKLLRRPENREILAGFTGGVVMDSASELYTKSAAAELVFTANMSGCGFVGKPLVEGTGSLMNFRIAAKNLGTDDLMEAYRESVRSLLRVLADFRGYRAERPKLLALHASSHKTSNTYALWRGVADRLEGTDHAEIGLRNGTVYDCSGCPYRMCLHYGEKESCFYGGVMVENVYPALREADAILMVCPNYNDSLSANLTAFINRLTALYRKRQFYDKALFAIIVSGYSGCDIIAKQLIAALNMNKNFYLPPHFTMMETANGPGEAMALPGIGGRMEAFARNIEETLKE